MNGRGVRISAGRLKGVRLRVPKTVRPTGGRLREALFDSWQSRLPAACLLDLFAGSGAVGLEAASRGAEHVLCLESDGLAVREARSAAARWAPEAVSVVRADLPDDLGRAVGDLRFDLAFADPPYAFDRYEELIAGVGELLAVDGELAVEHAKRVELPDVAGRLGRVRSRRYGDSCLSYYAPLD